VSEGVQDLCETAVAGKRRRVLGHPRRHALEALQGGPKLGGEALHLSVSTSNTPLAINAARSKFLDDLLVGKLICHVNLPYAPPAGLRLGRRRVRPSSTPAR